MSEPSYKCKEVTVRIRPVDRLGGVELEVQVVTENSRQGYVHLLPEDEFHSMFRKYLLHAAQKIEQAIEESRKR